MPWLFIIIGVVMITAAARDTVADYKDANGNAQSGLTTLLKNDFIGTNNFTYWVLSILVIGAIGYIEPLKPISRAFLVLVVIVLIVSHGGVFEQFNAALKQTQEKQKGN